MATESEKIYAGPGIFTWGVDESGDPENDAVIFDMTQGGIRFYTETTYYEPTIDQTGTAAIDTFTTGTIGRVEFDTPDMDFAKVVKFNANASEVVDATDPDKVKYQVTGLAGKRLPRKRAMIQPQGVTDPSRFIYLESCGIKFDANAQFMLDDNQKFTINATAYPDLSATPRGLLYTWGDITATV